ncbi:uncharacterized protein LOC126778969 isoform X2 [Nymphalis io]|uniref:uncharacterized protein LOC126778969 isoform X2 n=1 Tax=Inachis io TaxID=171585 RepID=UPI002167AA33|nr:uncharacterized protein LOC126778969 isoform X2 [Nymphalis io]
MEKSKAFSENPKDIEKLVTAFCKHEILMEPAVKKLKKSEVKLAQIRAYKAMCIELDLPNIATVKFHIQSLKKFSANKMRQCVGLSINRGHGGHRDALSYAPDWLKKLDKPWKLVDNAVKAELVSSFKYHSAGRRTGQFVAGLLRCAERAAARARGPHAAARALAGADCFREYALAMKLDVDQLHGIWTRYYDQAVQKLMALINVGDHSENLSTIQRLTLQDWRVVDVGLMYDFRLRVVREPSFNNAITLYPMILLFKLMVAAKEKIDQRKAAQLKSNKTHTERQHKKSGAQTGTEGINVHKITETNVTPLRRNDSENIVSTSQAQTTKELSEEGLSIRKKNISNKACNEYETAEIWALVHLKYTNCGRSASAVLLQKRWYEMKQQTRALLFSVMSVPLLLAMAKRFPFILTETLPSWMELVESEQVFLDSDLEPYKIELFNTELEVPNIDENVLLDEIHDWSDDEVEIINEKREVITVTDSDDEQINDDTNNTPKTADLPINNGIKREVTDLKTEEDDSSIKKIESLNPSTAKVKIIFEDDSDSDVNEYLNSSENIYRKDNDIYCDSDEKPDCAIKDLNNTATQSIMDAEGNRTEDKDAGPSGECTNLNVKIPKVTYSDHKIEASNHGRNNSSINKNEKIKESINAFYNDSYDKLKYLQNTSHTKEPNSLSPEFTSNTIKSETIEQSDDTNSQVEATLENNEIINSKIPKNHIEDANCVNGAIKSETIKQSDDTNSQVEATLDNNEILNNNIPKSHIEDTNCVNEETSSNGQVSERDESDSLGCSVKCEIDSFNKESTIVDENFIRLAHVVLTPLEDIEIWRKYSKLVSINCRRFSVRDFSKPVQITLKQLAKCRPYFAPYRGKKNSISSQKKLEINQMPKILKQKRRLLTKILKLPRTYFSLKFWNERNIGLLELCRPVSVKLERVVRVVKKVELTDIDEVRRINKTILTAQVAPITVGSNRTIVINPSMKPLANSLHTPVQPALVQPTVVHPALVQPAVVQPVVVQPAVVQPTVVHPALVLPAVQHAVVQPKLGQPALVQPADAFTRNQVSNDVPTKTNPALNINLPNETEVKKINKLKVVIDPSKKPPDTPSQTPVQRTDTSKNNQESNDEPTETNPAFNVNLPNETEVKQMIKDIVRKGVIGKLPMVAQFLPLKNDAEFGLKQRTLDKDIREISTKLLKNYEVELQRKKEKETAFMRTELKLDPNINCSQEWQRQKSQNLIYFNFRPAPDEQTDTERNKTENKKSHNTKKRHKKTNNRKPATKRVGINKETNPMLSEKVNQILSIDEAASDGTKDLVLNDSSAACVDSSKLSDSDSETDRLVINLDNTTDEDLKRKSEATQSDILCKIAKTNSNTIETEDNTRNIEPNCVIDLCDDSNDNTHVRGDGEHNVLNNKATDDESTPQINIKIVKNKIEIDGDCKNQVAENKSEEVLTFLSKVAGKIQAKNMTKSVSPTPVTNNSTVYYVVKSVDKNKQTTETSEINTSNVIISETITNTTTYTQTISTKADEVKDANVSVTANSSSLYYVVKIPDLQSEAATPFMSPLPGTFAPPVPIIQSVPAMNQMPQQLQQYSPLTNLPTYPNNFGDVIDRSYANNLYSLTSIPMQRNKSLPMPITSVTAWPNQMDSKLKPLHVEWPMNSSQLIYPVTVTSGTSRTETIKDVTDVSLSSAPWNLSKTKHSDVTVMPITSVTSDSSQDKRTPSQPHPNLALSFPAKKSRKRRTFINDSFS